MPSRPDRLRRISLTVVFVLGVVPAWLGCGTRYARTTIHDDDAVSIVLRAELRGGEPVERHFRHPATISPIRLAHILSRIDIRTAVDEDGGKRRPAIDTSLIYPLGDLLSQALAKAKSDQEIVVQATRKEKRLGIFQQEYLTSFIAYVGGDDRLVVHLYRIDWPVPKSDNVEIKEPVVGREAMSFRAIPGDAMKSLGHQAVAVEWRDPLFRKASNIRVGPTGKVMRRTILMEAPVEAAEDVPEAPREIIPSDPTALRALAELEEAREQGQITEADYRAKRRAILQGEAP